MSVKKKEINVYRTDLEIIDGYIWIEIRFGNSKRLLLACIYLNPILSVFLFRNFLNIISTKLVNYDYNILIIGDSM